MQISAKVASIVCYRSVREIGENLQSIPLLPVNRESFEEWKASASPARLQWVEQSGFDASSGQSCSLPGEDGTLEAYLLGVPEGDPLYCLSGHAGRLPAGVYHIESDWSPFERTQASLGWGLALYRFDRYKSSDKPRAELVLDTDIEADVRSLHSAQCLVRDLVNTPTEHMGPGELADAVIAEADRFQARVRIVAGEDLLTDNFPAIHAVGRASSREPRLVEMDWGEEGNPLVVLVGKGVCFDTGGLDLKTATGMALMKKDMGGAAHALAAARLIMENRVPVRIKVLIAAVENSVSGNAYRPGDIIPTRKGLSVEIGNTDAEGRVILSDALALACESSPDLVIDFATLTGAARIALGADLMPVFSNRDEVAQEIRQAGEEVEDPMWVMPLFQPYRKIIESPIADINNSGKSAYGGCITAALFLEHFVEPDIPWVHIDTFAWNQSDRPGRPQGGEALSLRAVYRYLRSRYG